MFLRLCVVLALAFAAFAEQTLPTRGDQVSTYGSVTAASGYVGPSYSSKLHQALQSEGNNWQADTVYWTGMGTSNGVLLDYGDYTCSLTQIKLQADNNDDWYVDYYHSGVWTPIRMGYCMNGNTGPASCLSTGDGMRTRTLNVNVAGVSKLRAYCTGGDNYCSVSRLFAVGSCKPGGILPTKTESISTTGTINTPSGYLVTPASSKLHSAMQDEGTQWQSDTLWWTGTGTTNSVVVDLIGTCTINKIYLQADCNDTPNVQYYANGQWTSVSFGQCDGSQGARLGICASYGAGMRTWKLPVSMPGATRLRAICTSDGNCAVSRLFAYGTCINPTLDPAVTSYCGDVNARCTELTGHCTSLRSDGGNVYNPANGHVYRLVTTASPTAPSFNGMRAQAQALGAGWDLVIINDNAEFAFVRDNIVAPSYVGGVQGSVREYSVGAKDSASGWKWWDGTSVDLSLFGGGEPNNHNSYLPDYPVAGFDNRMSWKFNDYRNEDYCMGLSGCEVVGFVAEKSVTALNLNAADNCDATVSACHNVHSDCLAKAASCPLV